MEKWQLTKGEELWLLCATRGRREHADICVKEKRKDSPEEQHQGHDEGPEVIVIVDGSLSLLI